MFTSSSSGIPSFGDLAWHGAVRAATAAALPANTYVNGPPATLTANANGVLPAIDGITMLVGDRLLLKNEANTAHNGIYTVTSLGSAGAPWVLTRAADADTAAELPLGSIAYCQLGTVNTLTYFVLTAAVVNIDTSGETWFTIGAFWQVFTRIYTAGSTWTFPPYPTFIGARVRVVGGGGGGGGAVLTAAGQGSAGAGGGGGGYAERFLNLAALAGANQTVTIGAGGAANVGAAGGAGGASSFGALVAAGGGLGGGVTAATAANAVKLGPAAGIGTAGTILARGDDGGPGHVAAGFALLTGAGGGTVLGGARAQPNPSTAGNAGNPYGGGGSGASNGSAAAAIAGGAGAAGVVYVEEYYSV